LTISRANVALLGIAVVLFAVLAVDLVNDEAPVIEQVEWPGIDPDEIDRVRLANARGEIEARRVDFRWQFEDGSPLDPDLMSKVLYMFDEPLRPDIKVVDEADNPALYGLGDGERIEIELFVGEERQVALEIGRGLAGGVSFVRPLGSEPVWRARIPTRFRLDKPPSLWRDPHVLDLPEGRVDRLVFQRGGEIWHLERLTESWLCSELPEMMLDARLVEATARGLGKLRAASIVDQAPDAAFAEIPLAIDVTAQEAGTHRLEFGGTTEDGSRYVRRDGQVWLLSASRFETFDKTPHDLRDRTICRVDWREIDRVTVRKGPWRFVAEPTGEKTWTLVEPRGFSIDEREMAYSLNALVFLRAFGLDDDVAPADAGVDDAEALHFTIERTESRPVEVSISPIHDDLHHVVREGRDQTYTLRVPSARLLVKGFGLSFE
jgi:hypothetical protein